MAKIEHGIAGSTRKELNRTIFERLLHGSRVVPFDKAPSSTMVRFGLPWSDEAS